MGFTGRRGRHWSFYIFQETVAPHSLEGYDSGLIGAGFVSYEGMALAMPHIAERNRGF